jgi:ubiquinone/menaquinone biosynthesis C-methylase UbiE
LDQNKLNQQSNYWETNFLAKPEMFGSMPSKAALSALKKLKEENIEEIVELGAGLGRDTIHFAENKIKVEALDYSSAAIKIIGKKVKEKNLSSLVTTKFFDVRHKLPYKDNSIKGFYSHMLYCMALTNSNIEKLNNEILRVLKPGGINIYTVRHIDDGDYKKGIHRGDDMYENNGFIVNFFSENKVKSLLKGFENISITKFEEGNFPRKLFLVQNKKSN